MSNIQLNILNISWCNGGLTEKVFYGTSRALTSLTENYIMEGVRSPSPEIYDYCLKKNYLICYLTLLWILFQIGSD